MTNFVASLLVTALASACVIPPPAQGTAPQQAYYAGPTARPAPGPTAPMSAGLTASPAAPATARHVRFNGLDLDQRGWQVIAQLEASYQTRLPDGEYWYDARTGAAGPWGGPMAVALPADLPLGGAMPASASGGGNGQLTGVFVNGRELHPNDVAALMSFTQVQPGRYWVDAQGNGGYEGGPALFNLYALAKAAKSRGGGSNYMKDANGSIWTGGGGFDSSWKSDGGTVTHGCSYDPNDGAGVMCDSHSN
jgi:hypothetical protein